MAVKVISQSNLLESMGPGRDRTRPLDLQSDAYLQSDALPVFAFCNLRRLSKMSINFFITLGP